MEARMETRLVLRPLVRLHMPPGRVRRWAEDAAAAAGGSVWPKPVHDGVTVHWGYLEGPTPPDSWNLREGKWVITSSLPEGLWRFPRGFLPAAVIAPFEDRAKAAAAIKAVAFGWDLRIDLRSDHRLGEFAGRGVNPVRAEEALDRGDWPILSEHEMKVLEELARGEPNKSIAAKLNVSESTVRFHVQNIFRKLGAQNRAGAVARAFERGLLII